MVFPSVAMRPTPGPKELPDGLAGDDVVRHHAPPLRGRGHCRVCGPHRRGGGRVQGLHMKGPAMAVDPEGNANFTFTGKVRSSQN